MSSAPIDALFEQLHAGLSGIEGKTLFGKEHPILIYGAGSFGKDICRVLLGQNLTVKAFLDRKAKPGDSWESIPVLGPDDPHLSTGLRKEARVIIGIFNRDVEIPPVIQFLKTLGYAHIITPLDLYDFLAAEMGDRFWLTSRNYYVKRQEEVTKGHGLWSDEQSRNLYASTLKFRFANAYEALPAPCFEDQYFPTGLPPWPSPLRLIDCGAYDGDLLRYLVEKKISVRAFAAFEPDPLNFKKLAQSAISFPGDNLETSALFPCGVSSETSQLRFRTGIGEASHACEDGETVIQCVAIDDALPGFRPNLIKMDIEGAEPAALQGARRTIDHYRPGLAICVYHHPEHLWSIPLMIASWVKGGKHYLRSHGYSSFDLVYYWIP